MTAPQPQRTTFFLFAELTELRKSRTVWCRVSGTIAGPPFDTLPRQPSQNPSNIAHFSGGGLMATRTRSSPLLERVRLAVLTPMRFADGPHDPGQGALFADSALPDTKNTPSVVAEFTSYSRISSPIRYDLRLPEFFIAFRWSVTTRTPMPETSIDK
jgi:hypothetical protein